MLSNSRALSGKKKSKIIRLAEELAKRRLKGEPSGHDWHHVDRVRRLAMKICSKEGGDKFVVELAALLHDIAIGSELTKGADHAKEGAKMADRFLARAGVSREVRARVFEAIRLHRFGRGSKPKPIEVAILQDADRLDALGAIGIARAFAYAGAYGAPIWDPEESVEEYDPYRVKSAIVHFYEKLLKIPRQLNTASARKLVKKRAAYTRAFLNRFLEEWKGNTYV